MTEIIVRDYRDGANNGRMLADVWEGSKFITCLALTMYGIKEYPEGGQYPAGVIKAETKYQHEVYTKQLEGCRG